MNSAHRITLPLDRLEADGNIRFGHPAERAAWIWARGRGIEESAFLRFRLPFDWAGGDVLRLHVTADQRYQLFLDGRPISYGPDRSDVEHWSVTTLEVPCTPGWHELSALVWFIAEPKSLSGATSSTGEAFPAPAKPPMAQMSHRPGFLVSGSEQSEPALFDTGFAAWEVADLTSAVKLTGSRNLSCHEIGPAFSFAMKNWNQPSPEWERAVVVAHGLAASEFGVRAAGWVLQNTPLPEQRRVLFAGGRVRSWRRVGKDISPWSEGGPADSPDWNACLHEKLPIIIPPESFWEVLWDLESYQCGYPALEWSGGAGAEVGLDWAEALYKPTAGEELNAAASKGNRNEIDGKLWLGFGDTFVSSGSGPESSPGLWWRSGRYLRLRIRTGPDPLTLCRIAILRTEYPFERGWKWTSSDAGWDMVMELMARGLELGAHEIWADSPYYEQAAYVGDNALHMLSNLVGYPDLRLTRRGLDLFDWSRVGSLGGFVAERYPSASRQESVTYAMLYPCMLRNHLLWAGDEEFLRGKLTGLRQLLEAILALRGDDGFLHKLPGWSFVDWVPSWHLGSGPGVLEGDSSIVNLHLVLALQAAATMEEHLGDSYLKARYEHLATTVMQAVVERYWDADRQLLRDTMLPGDFPSEHAQVLALLTNLLSAEKRNHALRHLRDGRLPAQCTVYFSHYLLEALAANGEEKAFFQRLEFWRKLPDMGFTALPESPEPSRSDCHGWGAHPFFHTFADIAGVRPSSPGFRTVFIRPMPGPFDSFSATVVHPRGQITVSYDRSSSKLGNPFVISLPPGIQGELHFRGKRIPLPIT